MYLGFAIISGLIGGFLSVMMRIELAEPGIQMFTGRPNGLWHDCRCGSRTGQAHV